MNVFAFVLLCTMLLHPAQESLAELQFNEKSQRVEVALRLSTTDEQQLLQSVSKSSARDASRNPNDLEHAALTVLRKRLRFGTKDGLTAADLSAESADAYGWIGRQSEGAHVWWYFTYAGTPGQLTHLRCTLFAAPDRNNQKSRSASDHDHLHADPISTFVVLHRKQSGAPPKSFTTTREKPVHKIAW